ncbi:Acyl-CoA synthetase (AMP-forming)/AMP-acid ligase II [Micromonospora phaseoli]|uniref:Acyl-CoA synthetase (AMP-forming)/AMP-acid ligase II n=1 Tax=Micromonospora phaseoli TaxID=1144548 RepID=A0A1H7DZ12_9ACTN|nr:class I adenylate-forming enzyme family protein [Micromonospora phaseoli]PZV99202.1 acyl-CoA synthetase (AMP-forming)/AMP-acid ligase II [Micromonospora phaseoli]GIJ80002.1 AMP-dependent synthetase and ligase [Micromonospora phaseoli]SEK04912.1 Acyl-CoA synthetase (AMP-forming)/AMP-acid ligase II [Micromonospora phaseoli]
MSTDLLHGLLDRTATEHPDADSVTDSTDRLSYRQLRVRSLRLAGWLRRQGVRRGDRVLVALSTDALLPALLYGISRIGAVFAVIRVPAPEVALAHVLDDAEPVLTLTDEPLLRELSLARDVAVRGRAALATAADSEVRPDSPAAEEPLAVDPICLIYTSGSTGLPKAVVSTHAQVTFAVRAIGAQLSYRADDVVHDVLPTSFDYGLYQIFLSTAAGCRLHLGDPGQTGGRLLVSLRQSGATVLPCVPSLAINLLRLLRRPGAARPALRLITNTGATMPPEVLAGLRDQLPDLKVQLMFGLTECKRAAILPPDEDLRRPGSCGRALPGTEIFTVDVAGRRQPPDTTGELVVRGPHVMAGYWRRPELTAERFRRRDGLFPQLHTGDYGRVDAEGYVYYIGRRDDVYKEKGTRVSATEVEAAAYRVDGVEVAGVLPPVAGQDGATLFVVAPWAADDILRRLRGQLEEMKVPARCVVLPNLPLNGNGKVDRRALARLAGECRG